VSKATSVTAQAL